MKKASISLWLLVVALVAAPVAKAGGWHVYESDNFRIVADKKRKDAKRQLHDLELFRQAASLFTGLEQHGEKQRLTILFLQKSKNYLKVFDQKKAAGFYVNSMTGPYMVVGPADSEESTAITLRHEYVHHLLHSYGDKHFPKWYDEGIADLLSTARVSSNSVAIGAPHPWRRAQLSYGHIMGFSDLLVPANFFKEGDYGSLYYSTAWLATHYFLLGELNGADLQGANINRYLAGYNQGITSPLAFEELIGRDFLGLNASLKRYAMRRELAGFRLPVKPYKGSFKVSRLNSNAQKFELALVALALEKWAVVADLTKKIKKADGRDNLQALHTLAKVNLDSDQPSIDLKAAQSLSPLAQILMAAAMVRVAEKYPDKAPLWSDAHKLASAGLTHYPHNLYAREVLWTVAEHNKDSKALIAELRKAHSYYPANIRLNYLLGDALYKEGKPAEAEPYLQNVLLWSHDRKLAEEALSLLQAIEN